MPELTWRKAIDTVLSSSSIPLHYSEITERIISERLRTNLGATPPATVNALISSSIKHDKDLSPYLRVSRGTFTLRSRAPDTTIVLPKLTPDISESDELEDQYEIITSFGMFWRKEAIEWIATP
ncbi:MAG: winged helix-turn-helix domain-containing protein, partial [Candidatus Contendobacter sp.]|nr:winged helix-turn-helix domain-containing protein [Candidatus Contendobacter sp.]